MQPPSLLAACAALILIASAGSAGAAEVRLVEWETQNAALPASFDGTAKDLLPLIRLGVSSVPEPVIMQMTALGGTALGLPADKAEQLQSLLAERYRIIAEDPLFRSAPSSLAYCYSDSTPASGQATVYVPDVVSSETPVLLFLHGYGGSFVFYQHYLAAAFPEHLIICPAFGISAADISREYLGECLEAVEKNLGFAKMKSPILMGLSAGGFGGFREYARNSPGYLGYIGLATYPPSDFLTLSPRAGIIRVLAGGQEPFVQSGDLEDLGRILRQRTPNCELRLIPEADHFFLLTHEEVTTRILQEWVEAIGATALDPAR